MEIFAFIYIEGVNAQCLFIPLKYATINIINEINLLIEYGPVIYRSKQKMMLYEPIFDIHIDVLNILVKWCILASVNSKSSKHLYSPTSLPKCYNYAIKKTVSDFLCSEMELYNSIINLSQLNGIKVNIVSSVLYVYNKV